MIATLVFTASLFLPPIIPPEEIVRGQRGTCITVFEGDTIEPFDFVVKGVMKNYLGPEQDLVLVRLLGEKPEFTGVVAGMSGSPCSIDGRIIGALSYAFAAFAKEPIAGITPMKAMLETLELPAERRPWRMDGVAPSKSVRGAAAPPVNDWAAFRDGLADSKIQAPMAEASAGGMQPIATPLTMGGVLPRVLNHFSPWLQARGFVPVAGGVSSGKGTRADIKPGSPVCAVLVSGDVDVAATGTVTAVEGDAVLAFGHPFLGVGPVSVPLATATILNTMSSMQRSFKMSETGAIVGEFTQDRLPAIAGYLGKVPKMVPVHGQVDGVGGKRAFSFDVARDYGLSPRFVAIGLSNALYGAVDVGERGMVRLKGVVKAKGVEPLVVESVYAGQRDGGMLMGAAIDMARSFATLWSTPFGPPPDMALSVEVKVEADPVEEWIDALYLDRAIVRGGDAIEVAVRLGRDDGPHATERFHLQIPRGWAGQDVDVIAASVDAAGDVAGFIQGDPRPTSLADVRTWLAQRRHGGFLYLMVVRAGAGMQSEVQPMPFLPPSVVAIMSGDSNKQKRRLGVAWEERRARPGVIYGGKSTRLRVVRQ